MRFEVEKVIGVSNEGTYQIQWAPCWVSKSHLVGCEHLIKEFLQQQQSTQNSHHEDHDIDSGVDGVDGGGGECGGTGWLEPLLQDVRMRETIDYVHDDCVISIPSPGVDNSTASVPTSPADSPVVANHSIDDEADRIDIWSLFAPPPQQQQQEQQKQQQQQQQQQPRVETLCSNGVENGMECKTEGEEETIILDDTPGSTVGHACRNSPTNTLTNIPPQPNTQRTKRTNTQTNKPINTRRNSRINARISKLRNSCYTNVIDMTTSPTSPSEVEEVYVIKQEGEHLSNGGLSTCEHLSNGGVSTCSRVSCEPSTSSQGAKEETTTSSSPVSDKS